MTAHEQTPHQKSLAGLEWPRLWAALAGHTRTLPGAQAAQGDPFLVGAEEIRASMRRVEEMARLQETRGELSFAGVSDLEALLERAEKGGGLEAAELLAVLNTQRAALATADALQAGEEMPLLAGLATAVLPEQALCAELEKSFTQDGELSEKTYPRLGALRREVAARREEIHRRLDGMVRSRGLANALQEKIHTLRGSRYVLPVKADFRGQVPGIVHDISASGATLFIEPQAVVEESNALTMAVRQREVLAAAILAELSAKVGASGPALRQNLAWLGGVDLLHARATLSRGYGGKSPLVGVEGRIALRGVANPLMVLEKQPTVRNDFSLGGEVRCMVISGANTGGKTVLLKSVGLCALLVRAGMPIPAGEGSRLDVFAGICADIGDQQDLAHSLSTFSAQIRFMTKVLEASGPESLVLVDEILTGTSPQEGAALAGAILERLAEQGAVTLVTTHYGDLKELAAAHPAMVNASVSFDPENLAPTYHLLPTTPGASYAFPIARRYGLPDLLVNRAEEALAGRPAQADALLTEARATELRLRERAEELEQLAASHGAREQKLAAAERKLAEKEWRVRKNEQGKLGEAFEQARREIAQVIEELRGGKTLRAAGKASHRLAELREETLQPLPEPGPVLPPMEPERLQPGARVYLRSMGQIAELGQVTAGGKRAKVRLGALTMEVEVTELAQPPKPATIPPRTLAREEAPPPKEKRTATKAASGGGAGRKEPGEIGPVLPTSENTLDLRGTRLEEALELSEQFFDQCVMKYVNPVVLIHGHGTGVLKKGLREKLLESRYVANFRPGTGGEGWDGVTIVALNL